MRRKRREKTVAPWARRRRRAAIGLLLIALLFSPWLVWRLRIKTELRATLAEIRAAGVPTTQEERAAWEATLPACATTSVFQDAAAVYTILPLDVVADLPTFRTQNSEDYLYARPYPEARLAAMREAVRLNEAAVAILRQARDLPPDVRAPGLAVDETLELLCAEACVRAAAGDGAGAADAVLCGLRFLACIAAPYETAPRWSPPELERLLNALLSAAGQTALPDASLATIRGLLDPTRWEEQYRLASVDRMSDWIILMDEIRLEPEMVAGNILFGLFDRQFFYQLKEWQVQQSLIGKSQAEQASILMAVADEPWNFSRRSVPPVHLEVARLAIDLVRFYQDRGTLPETLEALAPDYRDATPVNEWTGAAFHFEAVGTAFEVAEEAPGVSDEPHPRRHAVRFRADLPPR